MTTDFIFLDIVLQLNGALSSVIDLHILQVARTYEYKRYETISLITCETYSTVFNRKI